MKNATNRSNSNGHIVSCCRYHVVFCPKYRRKIFKAPYDTRLRQVFEEVAQKRNFQILEMEIMPDHVHLLIECNPEYGIMQCIKNLKGVSARTLRTEYPEIKKRLPCVWTKSCYIASVGSVSLETVKHYIENQKGK